MKKLSYFVVAVALVWMITGCQNQSAQDFPGAQDTNRPQTDLQQPQEPTWNIVGQVEQTLYALDDENKLYEFPTADQKAGISSGKLIFENPKTVGVGLNQLMILGQDGSVYFYGTAAEAVLGYSLPEAQHVPVKIYSGANSMHYLKECGTLLVETKEGELLVSGTPVAQMPAGGEYVVDQYGDSIAVFPTVKIADVPPVQGVYTQSWRSTMDTSACFILTTQGELYTLKNGELVRVLEAVQAVSEQGPSVLAVLKTGEVYLVYDYELRCQPLGLTIPEATRLQACIDFYFYYTAEDDLYCFGTAYQDGLLTAYHESPGQKMSIETGSLVKVSQAVAGLSMHFAQDVWTLLLRTKDGSLKLMSTDGPRQATEIMSGVVDYAVADQTAQVVYGLNAAQELLQYSSTTGTWTKIDNQVVALAPSGLYLTK